MTTQADFTEEEWARLERAPIVAGMAISLADPGGPIEAVKESMATIKTVLEDVADNLFHPDPYYRQGGDMVRLGGLTYAIDPAQPFGRRISDIRVGARPLEPARRYKTAGWASVATEADGPPAWDVVADHLRRLGRIRLDPRPRVRVV